MPCNYKGTGTRFHGAREHHFNGSYITTKWIVVCGFPLVPLSSWRVYPVDAEHARGRTGLVVEDDFVTSQFFEAQRVPMNWRQVANVYAVTAVVMAVCARVFDLVFPGAVIKF